MTLYHDINDNTKRNLLKSTADDQNGFHLMPNVGSILINGCDFLAAIFTADFSISHTRIVVLKNSS